MSRDSSVSDLPSNGWSCATLAEGVEKCAQMAGLKIQPSDLGKARMPTGGMLFADCHRSESYIYIYERPFKFGTPQTI